LRRERQRSEHERTLVTVLFTDIVGSTERAAALGDRRWKELLLQHHAIVRQELQRFGGREIDTAGDGFLASFEGPERAVRCALAVSHAVRPLGINVRVGLHTGECEVIGEKVGGIGLHIGARVAGLAKADEVLVSSTVKDLVAGSGLRFMDRGVHALRGIPGEWRLFSAEDVQSEEGRRPDHYRRAPRGLKPALWVTVAALTVAAGGLLWAWRVSQPAAPMPAGASAATETDNAQQRVRALQNQANLLGVDQTDRQFQDGMRLIRSAARLAGGGAAGERGRFFIDAETAFDAAIRSAARTALMGTDSRGVTLAVQLCARPGQHCSAQDFADEVPRNVALQPFALDETEVTNKEFSDFVAATGQMTQAERVHGLYEIKNSESVFRPEETWKTLAAGASTNADEAVKYPVRGVEYESAQKYCAWVGKRLPTEDEWEFVARGPERKIFPWGNDPQSPAAARTLRLMPAHEEPPTGRFGVRGLGGALWEWTQSGLPTRRVLRGASWLDSALVHRRLATRRVEDPSRAHTDTGFRCAQSAAVWPDQLLRAANTAP